MFRGDSHTATPVNQQETGAGGPLCASSERSGTSVIVVVFLPVRLCQEEIMRVGSTHLTPDPLSQIPLQVREEGGGQEVVAG